PSKLKDCSAFFSHLPDLFLSFQKKMPNQEVTTFLKERAMVRRKKKRPVHKKKGSGSKKRRMHFDVKFFRTTWKTWWKWTEKHKEYRLVWGAPVALVAVLLIAGVLMNSRGHYSLSASSKVKELYLRAGE